MINFKKGPALSLHQVNYVGAPEAGSEIQAGMVVRVHTDGTIKKGASSATAPVDALYGFAINNYNAGDAVEAGKIGVYALDGMSVVETDQTAQTITPTNYPIGKALSVGTDGLVKAVETNYTGKIIGWVEGIRTIPGQANTRTTLSSGREFTYPSSTAVLGVKLAS